MPKNLMPKKVICAISGGVDSAICAYLLSRTRGINVEGIFMRNWDLNVELKSCTTDEDYDSAKLVCNKLNIKLHTVNFAKEYWNYVFEPMLNDLKCGFSQNIDIFCNKYIKFGYLYEYVKKYFNADYLATGHYAINSCDDIDEKSDFLPPENCDDTFLRISRDKIKDQTFFLSNINRYFLNKLLFPIGKYRKSEIFKIAQNLDFKWLLRRKSSRGICFVGKNRDFGEFLLQNFLTQNHGNIVDIESNEIVGKHKAHFTYTIGQAIKNGLSSKFKDNRKMFVVKKDANKNVIYVSHCRFHKCSIHSKLKLNDFNALISQKLLDAKILQNKSKIFFKSQSMALPQLCSLKKEKEDYYVYFINYSNSDDNDNNDNDNDLLPYGPFAEGQSLAFYDNNQNCIGGAILKYCE